jgi:hypothetical protein
MGERKKLWVCISSGCGCDFAEFNVLVQIPDPGLENTGCQNARDAHLIKLVVLEAWELRVKDRKQ